MYRSWLSSFTAIFVAMDVIGMLPVYFKLTERMEADERRKVVDFSVIVALAVALVFAFLGQAVFRFLGIEIADFRVAGGLVLLLISLADLVGKPEHESRITGSSGVVPLAVPLISGPAVLTTILLHIESYGMMIAISALLTNFAITWFLMRRSGAVYRLLGKDGSVVASKLVALLLAAIAVSMIRGGLLQMIPRP
jgi:multiple antibiotic resistance protein